MAAEPVIKYAVVLPTSINRPNASEIRMAKRIARNSPSSRCKEIDREAIGLIAVESESSPQFIQRYTSPQSCRLVCISTMRRYGDVMTLTDDSDRIPIFRRRAQSRAAFWGVASILTTFPT